MANDDRPRGFEPVGKVLRTAPYVADAACYPGDLLERTATGKVQPMATGTAGAQLIGVSMSYAAADGDTVIVADHADQLYRVQADGADIAAQTDISLNYDVVVTAADSTYKISRMELDSDSGVVTAATPLNLVRIEPADNNALGANVDCIVRINMHALNNAAGTAGI